MKVEVKATNLDWLWRCLVGSIHDLGDFLNIQETFIMEGYQTIKIHYIGDHKVLMSGKKEDKLKDILKGEED